MKTLLSFLSGAASKERKAKERYKELVSQSRSPELFTNFSIPDTLDGRFESIVIFLFIEHMRIGVSKEDDPSIRLLHESFFEDMDRSLREGGVGDTGISKRVKTMAAALYGRLSTYEESWQDMSLFTAALKRNVYATSSTEISDDTVLKLAQMIVQKIGA